MLRTASHRRRGRGPLTARTTPPLIVEPSVTAAQRPSNAHAPRSDMVSTAMSDQPLDLEVGSRVHRLVGVALERGEGPGALPCIAAEIFTTWPTTRALAPSARLRCITAAATYIVRCLPVGFTLVGIEEPVGGGVADLVWSRGRSVLIDEMKTGRAAPTDRSVAEQVERLRSGGTERWPGFVGVRVLPLECVRQAWLMTPNGTVNHPIRAGRLAVA